MMKPREFLVVFARLAVGGVLVYAGFLKAAGPVAEFAAILEAYKLFPSAALTPLALGLPYVEMWVGLFVLSGLYTRYAALIAAILSTAFLSAVGSALARGLDLASCGCFGPDTLKPQHTLAIDVVLLALSLVIVKLGKLPPPLSLDRTLS